MERIDNRTRHDIEMLKVGICRVLKTIHVILMVENRERPYYFIRLFPDDFLLIVDESHVMLPQIRSMFNGDRSRKKHW